MTRKLDGKRLLVATHNAGKLEEIADLLKPFGVEVVGAAEMDLPEPEETGTTFVENARIKAHAAAQATGLPALVGRFRHRNRRARQGAGCLYRRLGRNRVRPGFCHGYEKDA